MGLVKKLLRYQREYGTLYTLRKIFYRFQIKYRLGKMQYPFELQEQVAEEQRRAFLELPVMISLVVPLYNTPEIYLQEMLESVCRQTYSGWELCLVDASDTDVESVRAMVEKFSLQYKGKIRYQRLKQNQGISENTNRGIELSSGEYIALLDHDDLLHPSALYYVVKAIQEQNADFIYTDELSFDSVPGRVQSIHLKPDFSQESFRNNNYICHFTTFKRSLLDRAGMFRKEFDGSQDYDLMLRLTDCAEQIYHIPEVLYYWRCHTGSVASAVGAKPYTVEAGRRAVMEHLQRRGLEGNVSSSEQYGPFYKVQYSVPEETKICLVSESIELREGLADATPSLPYLAEWTDSAGLQECESSVVVLLRNGYQPDSPLRELIQELVSCLMPPENFVVGSIVYDVHQRVCHGGVVFGRQWPAGIKKLYQGVPRLDPAYMNHLAFRQNVSLLSGAVLACRRELIDAYWKLCEEQGWDKELFSQEAWFALCLLAADCGGDCVITPYAPFLKRADEKDVEAKGKESKLIDWKNSRLQTVWRERLSQQDPFISPGMDVFGKYYFLWKD